MPGEPDRRRVETRARVLGVAVAVAAMTAATLALEWPAPGVSIALGIVVYLVARSRA